MGWRQSLEALSASKCLLGSAPSEEAILSDCMNLLSMQE